MRQANGTIVVYPIKDMVQGRIYQAAVKGLNGSVKTYGHHRDPLETAKVAKQWAGFTGFPVLQFGETEGFWLGVGVGFPSGRGQFEIGARTYVEAYAIAELAGLGEYPIQRLPFTSAPIHGTL